MRRLSHRVQLQGAEGAEGLEEGEGGKFREDAVIITGRSPPVLAWQLETKGEETSIVTASLHSRNPTAHYATTLRSLVWSTLLVVR